MDYLLNQVLELVKGEAKINVLNLIINGLPSKHIDIGMKMIMKA